MERKFIVVLVLAFLLMPVEGSTVIPGGLDMRDSFWSENGVTQVDFFSSWISVSLIEDSLVTFARSNELLTLAVSRNGKTTILDSSLETMAVRITPSIIGMGLDRLNESELYKSYPGMDVGLAFGLKPMVHFYDLNIVANEDDSVVMLKCFDESARWDIWLTDRNGNFATIKGVDPYLEIMRIRELGYDYAKIA